ncbi:MAG TPA: MFS transporter [Kofleriaceae bacterium]|nr:MFS transporter [Kofleriaceae bacterium]
MRSPIARLIGARSLNTFGRQLIGTTVYWEIYHRTRDNLIVAGLGLAQVIPVVLLFVWAGSLVDRSDRRTLSTIAASATGAIGVSLALASWFDAPPAVYLAIMLVQGCVTSVHAPASSSLIPLIIAREDLERTNRIGSSLQELAAILGPALAGLALIAVAPAYVYAFVAITGVASAIMYRALPAPRATPTTTPNARKDWRTGLRFIVRSPLLLPALTLDMFAVLFAGVNALLPAFAEHVLHTDAFGYGLLRSAQSAGAVIMAIVGGRLRPWQRPGRVLLIVVALFGLATIGFGFSRSLPLSVALLVVCGALDNISVVIRLTLEQMVVPDEIRGRVAAVHYVFIGMSNELGAAESGAVAWLIGTVPAIVAGGAIATVVVGFVAVRWRALAAMPPLSQL